MSVFATNEGPVASTKLNQKTVFVGTGAAIAALTTYAGMLAFCNSTGSGFTVDTLYERNTANSGWITVVGSTASNYQIGSSTTSSGVKTITFSPAFAGTPKLFLQITDGTDAIILITAKSSTQFSVLVRSLTVATFVSSISTGTVSVGSSSHTHSVPGLSVPSLSIAAATTANAVTGGSTISGYLVTASGTLYAAPSSGASPTSAFSAVSGYGAYEGFVYGLTVSAFVTAIPTATGTGTTGTGTTGSGGGSVTVVNSVTPTNNSAVTGWVNAGAVNFDWLARYA